MFLQLAAAPALLGSDELPKYKVVSHYESSKSSEMPGPYRGAVARVHSEGVIDPTTEHIDQTSVDKMLSAGMRALTGAKVDKEAWASFFSASDVVGIKVNCSGAPVIRASPEVVGGIVRNLVSVGVKADNIYIYERFLDQLTGVHYERFVPAGVRIVAIETPVSSLLGYDPKTFVEVSFFGEDDTRSNLARLVTERFTKIINVPNAKEHQASGVTGCLKNLAYGDFSNVARSHMREKTNTLSFIGTLRPRWSLCARSACSTLWMAFAAYGHGGPFSEERKYRFYPKLMMFGTDPVAIDRLLLDLIEEKRKAEGAPSLWDRSPEKIDRRAHLDFHKNTFIREPGHIEYAAKKLLGSASTRGTESESLLGGDLMLAAALLLPSLLAPGAEPPADAVKLNPPRVENRANEASATTSPWIDANGWRILRSPNRTFSDRVKGEAAALAAAEAFTYGARASVSADVAGATAFGRMSHFFCKTAFQAL